MAEMSNKMRQDETRQYENSRLAIFLFRDVTEYYYMNYWILLLFILNIIDLTFDARETKQNERDETKRNDNISCRGYL